VSSSLPKVSVIVPAYNAESTAGQCIECIHASTFRDFEVIVVDDDSTDCTAEIVQGAGGETGVQLVSLEQNSGAGAARNRGALAASGDLLFFVDADVLIKPDCMERLVASFDGPEQPDAVIGMYTRQPGLTDFYSRFQNCYTFFNHRKCEGRISWFWSACAMIKADVFRQTGGFTERYRGALVEDMDLGYELCAQGRVIVMNRRAEATHHRRFSLKTILENDFHKASAWAELFLWKNRTNRFKHEFTGARNALSLLSSYLAVVCAGLALKWPALGYAALGGLGVFLWANVAFVVFLLKEGGALFMLRGAPLYFLTFLVVGAASWVGVLDYFGARLGCRRPPENERALAPQRAEERT